MSKDTARQALLSLSDEEAALLNSDPELLGRFKQKHGLDIPEAPKPPSMASQFSSLNPMEVLKQAAPSNMMKLAGVGAANAPGFASLAINAAFPMVGNGNQVLPAIQNIRQNPGQGMTALKRIASVNSGEPLMRKEVIPARVGQVGGAAIEMMVPSLGTANIKAKGPFTAGLKDPSTVLPGNFEKVGEELGKAKQLARLGEKTNDASRFRVMLQKPSGVTKLAEEGKVALESGKDIPVTNLLAYKEALGKAQAEGGTFANDYKIAKDLANELIKAKAPDLSVKLEKMATNFAAKGNPKASFPWFTTALDPKIGLVKAATLPIVKNAAGAALSPLITKGPAIVIAAKRVADIAKEKEPIPEIKKPLTREQAIKFLKKAKGDKKLAEKMARDKGFDTERLSDE